MQLRSAKKTDFEAVLALMMHLNPDDPRVPESKSFPVFANILESDHLIITVAEKNDAIIGSYYLNVTPNLTRNVSPYAVIENVVTHPDFRRHGVGKALMAHALETAKNLGCYKVMLLTGRDRGVQTFYESCGMTTGSKTAFIVRHDG